MWTPDTNAIDFGVTYLQNRECSQNQVRTETLREYDAFSDSFRVVGTQQNQRVIDAFESQTAIGEYQNWVTYAPDYRPDWTDQGVAKGHGVWLPAIAMQTVTFPQSRSYLQPQYRNEQSREQDTVTLTIRDKGDLVRQDRDDTRSEDRGCC